MLEDLERDLGIQSSDFLRYYELPRIKTIFELISQTPQKKDCLNVLNIGYLNGLVPYVLLKLDAQDKLHITSTERSEAFQDIDISSVNFFKENHQLLELDLAELDENGNHPEWLPYYNEFDFIIFGEVIEHIPSIYAERIIRFFHHLLADNGRVIITTPNLHGFKMRLKHLLGADFFQDPIKHPAMGYLHINLFSSRLICDIAKANKFQIEEVLYKDFTSSPRAYGKESKRIIGLIEMLRLKTISTFFPTTRDDLVICLHKSDRICSTSTLYGKVDAGILESLRAIKIATNSQKNEKG